MDPEIWGKLPFHLLSNILRIEKKRLDEERRLDKERWLMGINNVNEHFLEAVSDCNWVYYDNDPNNWEILYLIGVRNRCEWRHAAIKAGMDEYNADCIYFPDQIEGLMWPHWHKYNGHYCGQ